MADCRAAIGIIPMGTPPFPKGAPPISTARHLPLLYLRRLYGEMVFETWRSSLMPIQVQPEAWFMRCFSRVLDGAILFKEACMSYIAQKCSGVTGSVLPRS